MKRKKDIQNRKNIVSLVDLFYDKIKVDPVIGYLFADVAHVDWNLHLPRMYDFWESILFYSGDFDGNPMLKHQELHRRSPMTEEHFAHWNVLFSETVDSLFVGKKATEIKLRASNISAMIVSKLN